MTSWPEGQELADQLTVPLLRLAADGTLLAVNQAAETLFGRSRAQLCGRSLAELDSGLAALLPRLQPWDEGQPDLVSRGLELTTYAGQRRFDCWLHQRDSDILLELHDLDPGDVDSRRRQQETQMAATLMTRHLLSHEIRNPLSGMRGAAQLLMSQVGDEELREYSQLIINEVDRLSQLIQRMAVPAEPPPRAPVNIHELLRAILDLLALDRDLALRVRQSFDPSIPNFMGDGDGIRQILLNLLRNARQAGARNIELTTRIEHGRAILGQRHGQVLRVSVSDDGDGVPDELEPLLFMPMVSSRQHGQGIGLALSQQIARAHRGIIEFERPEQGGGSRFHLLLPLEDAP